MTDAPRILGFFPTRAFFRAHEPITCSIEVSPAAVGSTHVELRVVDLDRIIAFSKIDADKNRHEVRILVDAGPGDSYGVHATLLDRSSGQTLDSAYTAVDSQNSWTDAPRYAFLSDFGSGEDYRQRSDELLTRHITAVQFYDWMYRHYRLLPPTPEFTDVLDRHISLESVKSAIFGLQARGIAAIAYGSVYGAEAEYALDHPDELLYDEQGDPKTLAGIFYLQDVRSGPWRDRILSEYREAVRGLSFDGIHADQYGVETFGTVAYDRAGQRVELAPALAGIVGAAHASVVEAGGDGIIFNFVTNWPLEEAAGEPQLATYIEVWPPYTTLAHLLDLIVGAKALAPQRQVILAAYMSCATANPDAAETATLLTSSTIHAAGGFHLLLGEGTGILVHAYYPNYVRPGQRFQERLLAHWNFLVRYGRYLSDRSLRYSSADVGAGNLWAIHRSGREFETVSLINADQGLPWDQLKSEPTAATDVSVSLPAPDSVKAIYAADPEHPEALTLPHRVADGILRFSVPKVDLWTLVIILK